MSFLAISRKREIGFDDKYNYGSFAILMGWVICMLLFKAKAAV
jgi:hypothetical protein